MKAGKDYVGILTRDVPCEGNRYDDEHYTFIETVSSTSCKRNPHVYEGNYITITRRDDGTLRLYFKHVKMRRGFNIVKYAFGVSAELVKSLNGLVEK